MNRIDILASLCKGSNIICDVGCDHGYVIVNALKYHGVNKALAVDIAKEPLNQARINVINNNFDDRVEFILSNGFKSVNSPFDTAVIAGMGGTLIADILNDGFNTIKGKKIIAEPNNHAELVREFMLKNGFIITNELAINDKNHYYEILVFEEGNKEYSDFEIKYGPILLSTRPIEFINHYQKLYDRLLSYMDKVNDEEKKKEIETLVYEYKKILEV